MTFEPGDKVVYRHTSSTGRVTTRKAVFKKYIRSRHANAELCLIVFQAGRFPMYAMTPQLTKIV